MSNVAPIIISLASNQNKEFRVEHGGVRGILIASGTITGTWKLQVEGPTSTSNSRVWVDTGKTITSSAPYQEFTAIQSLNYRLDGGTNTSGKVLVAYGTQT